jgi:hypothetical protein
MRELPPFGSHKVCPKCGGECMNRRYMGGVTTLSNNKTPEFMQVKCLGCGFDQMTEKVKDAPLSV